MISNRPFDCRAILSRFTQAKSGAVSLLLALGLPSVLGVVGIATDYAAVSKSRSQLQGVVDSAALAIVREMTITAVDGAKAQALASAYIGAHISDNPASVTATITESGLAVRVKASQKIKTPFGLIAALSGTDTLDVQALARVTASSIQTKLCMLSLGDKINGGLFMHNGSSIVAPECVLHSNSTKKEAVIVQTGSRIKANLLCSRGGVTNTAGILETTTLSDCPVVANPLANKPEPPTNGACIKGLPVVYFMGTHTLTPGVYCKGVFIFGLAKVKLTPGIYVFRDGPLVVAGNAELVGTGVSLLLTGKKTMINFHDNALINLTAPTTGPAAGMLIWETKGWVPGKNSWEFGGCGNTPSGSKSNKSTNATSPSSEDDDDGPTGCNTVLATIQKLMKKTNEHHINSDRAQVLTGTIYMPRGMLLIDSRRPVADQSPFTVFVINKLDLFDGPSLMLNANYGASPVPVPAGLGAIGASQVRLGN